MLDLNSPGSATRYHGRVFPTVNSQPNSGANLSGPLKNGSDNIGNPITVTPAGVGNRRQPGCDFSKRVDVDVTTHGRCIPSDIGRTDHEIMFAIQKRVTHRHTPLAILIRDPRIVLPRNRNDNLRAWVCCPAKGGTNNVGQAVIVTDSRITGSIKPPSKENLGINRYLTIQFSNITRSICRP